MGVQTDHKTAQPHILVASDAVVLNTGGADRRLHCRTNNSKLDLGSIENGCAAFDLPPEGPKKERWAIWLILVGFAGSR